MILSIGMKSSLQAQDLINYASWLPLCKIFRVPGCLPVVKSQNF